MVKEVLEKHAQLKSFMMALNAKAAKEIFSAISIFGRVTTKDLAKSLNVSDTAISPIVKRLKNAGLVKTESFEGTRYLVINDDGCENYLYVCELCEYSLPKKKTFEVNTI